MSHEPTQDTADGKPAYETPTVTTLEEQAIAGSLGPVRLTREASTIQPPASTPEPTHNQNHRR